MYDVYSLRWKTSWNADVDAAPDDKVIDANDGTDAQTHKQGPFLFYRELHKSANISQRRGRSKLANGGTQLDHVAEILRHKYRVWKGTDNLSCFYFKLTTTEDSALSQSSWVRSAAKVCFKTSVRENKLFGSYKEFSFFLYWLSFSNICIAPL